MKNFEGVWLPSVEEFKLECVKISKNLDNFKQNPVYANFIGNDLRDEETAIAFYKHIKENYPLLLERDTIDKFCKNDIIGSPYIYDIETNTISPGTLRFMRVLGDILEIDKDINSIVEIGSGYGGQCLVIKSYMDVDYSLVDIPESLLVSSAYLKLNKCDAKFMDTLNIRTDRYYDLVISDYCLSELDLTGITFYVENIISKCKHGYFTVNSSGTLFNELVKQLKTIFDTVSVEKEIPKTSYHDNHIIICKSNKLV